MADAEGTVASEKRSPIERQPWELPIGDKPPPEPASSPGLERYPGFWLGSAAQWKRRALAAESELRRRHAPNAITESERKPVKS
jgi:hypothetical protein